jgi:hypothetical protein
MISMIISYSDLDRIGVPSNLVINYNLSELINLNVNLYSLIQPFTTDEIDRSS